MKKFILKSSLFLVVSFLFIFIMSTFLLHTKIFKLNYYPEKVIYTAIDKSKKNNNSTTLLLGDSVANQIFNNEEEFEKLNSLATNRAISLAGQYFLLNDYLKTGNKIDTLIMLFVPWSFKNNLDQIYTYHYFLKPFYNSEYSDQFSKLVLTQIDKLEYNSFSQFPPIKITPWAPKFTPPNSFNFTFLSPISVDYLNKISHLSKQYNFSVKIIAPPISYERKLYIENIDKSEILQTELSSELFDYLEKVKFENKSNFSDGTHLINPKNYQSLLYHD